MHGALRGLAITLAGGAALAFAGAAWAQAGEAPASPSGTAAPLYEYQTAADPEGYTNDLTLLNAEEKAAAKPTTPKGKVTRNQFSPAGEAEWRERFRDLHARIRVRASEVSELEKSLELRPGETLKQKYKQDIQTPAGVQLEAKRLMLQALREKLQNLEARANQAGVPPAWRHE